MCNFPLVFPRAVFDNLELSIVAVVTLEKTAVLHQLNEVGIVVGLPLQCFRH